LFSDDVSRTAILIKHKVMKKLFFTAILVIAFSGVSMAKNVEVKKEVVMFTPCQDRAINMYLAFVDCNGGNDDWAYLNQLMGGCR
jgi:hypothetical protein